MRWAACGTALALCVSAGWAGAQPAIPLTPADVMRDGSTLLDARPLRMPIDGVSALDLRDTFNEGRPGHTHEAIDILAPRGTPVYAVDDGRLVKLFNSVPGGLTLYQFDPQGQLAYYYAHLDGYSKGLKEGATLRRGDLLGYVGYTGNASPDAPHLHFAVFRLGPEKQWWKGTPVNPFEALRRAALESAVDVRPHQPNLKQ